MAFSHGASLGQTLSGAAAKDPNLQRQIAQRVDQAREPGPGNLPIPGDYKLPSKGAADDYITSPANLPKTGQAADGYYSLERICKRAVGGAEGSLLTEDNIAF